MNGDAGADTITGGTGADVITGGTGADNLTGGDGADDYAYGAATGTALLTEAGSVVGAGATTAPSTTTADIITGFATGIDQITLTAAFGAKAASGTLIAAGGTAYAAGATTLVAADFISIVVGGIMTAVTADTAGVGRFLYDDTNDNLYYDQSGDTTMSAAGAWTAGAADDFLVAKGISGLAVTDFLFV